MHYCVHDVYGLVEDDCLSQAWTRAAWPVQPIGTVMTLGGLRGVVGMRVPSFSRKCFMLCDLDL